MPLTTLKLPSVALRAIIPVIDPGLCSKASPFAVFYWSRPTRLAAPGRAITAEPSAISRSELLKTLDCLAKDHGAQIGARDFSPRWSIATTASIWDCSLFPVIAVLATVVVMLEAARHPPPYMPIPAVSSRPHHRADRPLVWRAGRRRT
jgi:hypothetical protein